jgi:hypothetical protein
MRTVLAREEAVYTPRRFRMRDAAVSTAIDERKLKCRL